jgi:gamma-glutamyltranspeptidase/glutathione hydrolase
MVMNLVDFGMDIQAAIAAPRISFREPDSLAVEAGIAAEIIAELERLGHNIREVGGLGNAHGLTIIYGRDGRPRRFEGGADPRGDGTAAGY